MKKDKVWEYFYNRKGDVPAGGVDGLIRAPSEKAALAKLKRMYKGGGLYYVEPADPEFVKDNLENIE